MAKQSEWPRVKGNPDYGCVLHPNGVEQFGRNLVGPLRLGTSPGVGPGAARRDGTSDFGMDEIAVRRFDPMGSNNVRAPAREESKLISSEIRRSK